MLNVKFNPTMDCTCQFAPPLNPAGDDVLVKALQCAGLFVVDGPEFHSGNDRCILNRNAFQEIGTAGNRQEK